MHLNFHSKFENCSNLYLTKIKFKYGRRVSDFSKKPSRLWYLLPIFFGIIGGVIAYFILKDKDRKFAERMLIIGLVMIVVWLGLSFLLSFLAYTYISGVFTVRTASLIEVVDASCSDGVASFMIRNVGTDSLTASSLTCTAVSNPCSGACNPVSLEPGLTRTITISGCSSGTHSYRLSGPSNTITMSVYCP